MPRRSAAAEKPLPPCYAMVQPGLEAVAADEITRDLPGEVKKTARGLVVFRTDSVGPKILNLRTTEDIYLMAWGSDSLTYTAKDLQTIRDWTAKKTKWNDLFKLHAAVRGAGKGKPSFHIVTQMQGEHGYRRVDARDALIGGLAGKIPAHWRMVEDDADIEIWLTILSKTAVCGVRLSDRTMRHRKYKLEHIPASLRPTVAAAMVRLAGAAPDMKVLDPMCGAGTILAEQLELSKQRRLGGITLLGGDLDPQAAYCSDQNLKRLGPVFIARWDSVRLPLAGACVDRIVCNPPFGKQLSTPEEVGPLYRAVVWEWNRVLVPGGRAVVLVGELDELKAATAAVGWVPQRQVKVRVLGQQAVVSVWQKPFA